MKKYLPKQQSCLPPQSARQSGRSMIEMLAVLAIMGVLAIGGIAAYSFAVSKHRANQIYNQADLRAVASFGNPLVRRAVVGETYPLAGFDEVVENITYQHKKTAGNGYDIIASHVPERVCRRLQDMTFPVPKSVTLNGADLSSTCGSDNTFVFSYDGLSAGKPSSGVDPIDCNCSGCQSCESGVCRDNDNLCGPKEVCQSGSCVCAPGYTECRGNCYTTCSDGFMRDPISCDCVCEPQACPEDAKWDDNACTCVCDAFKEFDETQNKCVCKNVPIDGDPDTCECYEGYDLNKEGACVQECPDAIGMTGLRDNEGRCLCDTKLGYEKVSIDNTWCNCDNSKNYWNKPDGSCMTCVPTTKEWGKKQFGDSSSVDRDNPDAPGYMVPLYEVDSESVDEDGWYCAFHKVGVGERYYYNPSTQEYCGAMQILKKDASGAFYCSSDCGGSNATHEVGDRGGTWGSCGCGGYSLWVNDKGGTCGDGDSCRCASSCEEVGGINYDGECVACNINQTYDSENCRTGSPLCADLLGVDKTEVGWLYGTWLLNTEEFSECRTKESGYHVQSNDPASNCHWSKGCYKIEGILPNCNYNEVITSDCTCPTGGSAGEYCCSAAQIRTDSGCQTCTDNTIPNADKTACEACADDQIPSADRTTCQQCPDGQIPNVTKTKCYPCPDGKYPDASGTACI